MLRDIIYETDMVLIKIYDIAKNFIHDHPYATVKFLGIFMIFNVLAVSTTLMLASVGENEIITNTTEQFQNGLISQNTYTTNMFLFWITGLFIDYISVVVYALSALCAIIIIYIAIRYIILETNQ